MKDFTKDQIEILKRAEAVFTEEDQLVKLIEKLSELQKEACKHLLLETIDINEFLEETADVLIMIQQFILRYKSKDELLDWIEQKISRFDKKVTDMEDLQLLESDK